MHKNSIQMYETESALKKRYKAYLHVRDKADEMCRIDKQAIDVILDHYENTKKCMKQAVHFAQSFRGRSAFWVSSVSNL